MAAQDPSLKSVVGDAQPWLGVAASRCLLWGHSSRLLRRRVSDGTDSSDPERLTRTQVVRLPVTL